MKFFFAVLSIVLQELREIQRVLTGISPAEPDPVEAACNCQASCFELSKTLRIMINRCYIQYSFFYV